MTFHDERRVRRQAMDGALQPGVGDLGDVPAAVTDEVVVVRGVASGLVAGPLGADVQSLDQPEGAKPLEDPIDGRAADVGVLVGQEAGELGRRHRAVLLGQLPDDGLADPAAVAAFLERGDRRLRPLIGHGASVPRINTETHSQLRTRLRPLAAVTALGAATLALGCGSDDAGRSGKLRVAATTGFAAELARAVAGDSADVTQVIPASAAPHAYGASAQDRAAITTADLVVAFGRSYEEGLPLEDADGPLFEIAEHAGHEEGDPHVWMDPVLMAQASAGLAEELAEADPDGASGYRERAKEHAAGLRALDGELREILSGVPADRRRLVTSHDSLAYFAERYGFEIVATAFGRAPEAEASAQTVADVIATIRAEGIPVVFGQQGDDPRVVARIASEAGVEVVDDLVVENPKPGQGLAATLRRDAELIAGALGP